MSSVVSGAGAGWVSWPPESPPLEDSEILVEGLLIESEIDPELFEKEHPVMAIKLSAVSIERTVRISLPLMAERV